MSLKLSKELNERIASFFERHSARELNAGLRRMLLEHVCERSKVGVDSKLEEFICGMNDLMDLLDMAGRKAGSPKPEV